MPWPENLSVARRRKQLTQDELSRQIGEQATRISKWERGVGEPSVSQAIALAKALGSTVESIFDADNDPDSSSQFTRPPGSPIAREQVAIFEVVETLGPREALRRLLQVAATESSDPPPSSE